MPRTFAFIAFGFVVVFVGFGPGCSSSAKDEAVVEEERVRYGLGYYEVEHKGSTYVVGSDEAATGVRAGKLPKNTVHRFSSGGKQVLIDADDPATRARLEHEYDRRHAGR